MSRISHPLSALFGLVLLIAGPAIARAESGLDIEYAEIQPLAANSLLMDIVRIGDRLVAAGERGHIIYSDNGQDWVQAGVVPTRSTINRLLVLDDRIWAVGHDSVILTSGDRGESWTRQYFAPDRMQPIMDVHFSDADNGLVIGAYGLMMTTSDGGQSWTDVVVNEEDDYHLNAILSFPGGRYLIAGEAGYSYRSLDGGQTWQGMDMPYPGSMFGALETEGECVLFYGLRGHVQKSCDFGDSWTELDTGFEATLADAVYYQGRVVMAGNSGAVLEYADGVFSAHHHSSGVDFSAAISVGDDRFLLVGEEGVHAYPEAAPGEDGP